MVKIKSHKKIVVCLIIAINLIGTLTYLNGLNKHLLNPLFLAYNESLNLSEKVPPSYKPTIVKVTQNPSKDSVFSKDSVKIYAYINCTTTLTWVKLDWTENNWLSKNVVEMILIGEIKDSTTSIFIYEGSIPPRSKGTHIQYQIEALYLNQEFSDIYSYTVKDVTPIILILLLQYNMYQEETVRRDFTISLTVTLSIIVSSVILTYFIYRRIKKSKEVDELVTTILGLDL